MPTPRRHNTTAHLPWEDLRYPGDEDWRPDLPDWMSQAQCAGTDTEAFYPEKGGSSRQAKRLCFRCDVEAECLEWAIATGEPWGIFGGKSVKERRRIAQGRAATEHLAEAS